MTMVTTITEHNYEYQPKDILILNILNRYISEQKETDMKFLSSMDVDANTILTPIPKSLINLHNLKMNRILARYHKRRRVFKKINVNPKIESKRLELI